MVVEDRFEGREGSCVHCGYVAYLDIEARDMAAILEELESLPPPTPGEEPVVDEVTARRRTASAGRGWATRRREASKPVGLTIGEAMARARGMA